jgi:hypothetical protein
VGIVSTNDYQLMVQKRRLNNTLEDPQLNTIKGTNWSPASRCTPQSELAGEFATWYQKDFPLMAAMGINTVRTFTDLGTGTETTEILNELYDNQLMAIITVDNAIANSETITATVNAYKNHPAILMWSVGNEWDLNGYYGTFSNSSDAAAFTEWAAQVIHELDPNHPVTSVLSDIDRGAQSPATSEIVNGLVPSIGLWGSNVYRGQTFGNLFSRWRQISAKPLVEGRSTERRSIGAKSAPNRRPNDQQQNLQSGRMGPLPTGDRFGTDSSLSAASRSAPRLGRPTHWR